MKKINKKEFPKEGLSKDQLIQELKAAKLGDLKWKEGKSFCLVYYPGDERAAMIKEAFNLYFEENALNPMAFPSLRRFETEVVGMVADLLHGDEEATGTMTSGGTESIILAVKTAREYARKHKPEIIHPEIIVPITAHPAFDKAAHYFDIKLIHLPVKEDFRGDIAAFENAINPNTIMLVGSAPSYPHGVMDPIAELSELAIKNSLLLHVDSCIGGFILPFAKKLGYPIPEFDFALKGVTSISVDIHKYGYAAKGASIILYKNHDLRKHQFFVSTHWPGGIYASSSVAGSRPGGAVAASWAALNCIGEKGYLEMAKATMDTTVKIKKGIESIPELKIMAPTDITIIVFNSDTLNIYELADELTKMGYHFERLQNPAAIHLTVNYIHHNIGDQFLEDLRVAVEKVKKFRLKDIKTSIQIAAVRNLIKILPKGALAKLQAKFSSKVIPDSGNSAPMYGMMGALSGSDELENIVLNLLDTINSISPDISTSNSR